MRRRDRGVADATGIFVDDSFGLDGRGTPGCRYLTKTASRQIEHKPFVGEPHEFIQGFVARMLIQIGTWSREEFPKQMWQWREAPYSPASFEFIELKMPRGVKTSETPFAAATELLRYFAAFVAAQDYLSKPENKHPRTELQKDHVLRATQLKLTVLGPRHFYKGYKLSKVQRFLQDGLALYGKGRGWTLSFSFSAFSSNFEWSPSEGNPQQALDAYNAREFLFGEEWRRA